MKNPMVSTPLRLACLATVLMLLTAPTLQAQGSSVYYPMGGFVLEIDGEEILGSRFFRSQPPGTVLIQSPHLGGIFEFHPRTKRWDRYEIIAFRDDDAAVRHKNDGAKVVGSGAFELVDKLPAFEFNGKKFKMLLKAPLLGEQTQASIVEYDESWGKRKGLYTPYQQYVDRLGQFQEDIVIKLYFASWCDHCQNWVPRIFALEDLLADSNISFEYYGLPEGFQEEQAKKDKVNGVPTGLIMRDGSEIARVDGYSWQYPGMAIYNALSRAGAK